jgi:hypothetical protein
MSSIVGHIDQPKQAVPHLHGLAVGRADLAEALALRGGGTIGWGEKPGVQERLREFSVCDLIREWLRLKRLPAPASPAALRAAVSGGDVNDLFEAGVGAAILRGFESEPDHVSAWTTRLTVPNYKSVETFVLTEQGTLARVPRGEPPKHLDLVLSGESWKIARYGAQLVIDEQDMLDDRRLQVVMLASRQMGAAARRVVKDLVFSTLLANPELADSATLFHADHANSDSNALSEAALETGIAALASQTFTDRHGRPVHVNDWPAALLVPPDLAGEARKLVRAMTLEDGQDIRIIADSRLSATGVFDPAANELRTGSATNWFLAGKPGAFPSIVVGYLDGRSEPRVTSQPLPPGRGQWGLRIMVDLSVGVQAVGYRGLYRGNT